MRGLRGQQSTRVGEFQYYPDAGGDWRWRLVAANGEKVAHSGEGYASKQLVLDAIDRVIDYAATVVETRPEYLINKPNPTRSEILRGFGTKITQVEK